MTRVYASFPPEKKENTNQFYFLQRSAPLIFFKEIALLIYMKILLYLGCGLMPDSRRIVADQISTRRLDRVGYRFDAVQRDGKGG